MEGPLHIVYQISMKILNKIVSCFSDYITEKKKKKVKLEISMFLRFIMGKNVFDYMTEKFNKF